MKNILITGGAGFIGSHLVDQLLGEGAWNVTIVDDFNDFYDPSIKRANVSAHLANPDFKVIIRADKEMGYRYLEPVLEACMLAKVKNVNFNTSKGQ